MLLGAPLTIFTDHKNLTYKVTKFTTQQVLRWPLLLEEFGATFIYKKGEDNIIADALSRLPINRETPPSTLDAKYSSQEQDLFALDSELLDCLSDHPCDAFYETPIFDSEAPLCIATIPQHLKIYQDQDPDLQQKLRTQPNKYYKRKFGTIDLIVNKISHPNLLIPSIQNLQESEENSKSRRYIPT